jgi:hypothetical protein
MSKKSQVLVEPLFSELDRRRLIPLAEVAHRVGYTASQLRIYAINGTIPGGRQARKGKRWVFERDLLEAWWQDFNASKTEVAQ